MVQSPGSRTLFTYKDLSTYTTSFSVRHVLLNRGSAQSNDITVVLLHCTMYNVQYTYNTITIPGEQNKCSHIIGGALIVFTVVSYKVLSFG